MRTVARKTVGKYLSEESREALVQEAQDRALRRRWKRIGTLAALILGDGLLLGMILCGKIDTLFGVLFVAVLSALCGAKVKR